MDTSELKSSIAAEIDSRRSELVDLSLKIHQNPEIGFEEFKAVEWLTSYLSENGFLIKKGIADMPTAFRAAYGKGKPVLAILAEYDALPEIGHACGHNIICTAAVGAGIAGRLAADNYPGTVLVIGTPAEELQGGKIYMVSRGVFNDVDAALMVHPGIVDAAITKALACHNIDIEFFGKAAHAAAEPESGINALEAMIMSFNAINSLRQHIKPSSRIHGFIKDGGTAANIVPDHSEGLFMVRAEDDTYLNDLKERVLNCFIGAAKATGARLEYKWGENRYSAMRNNLTLAGLLINNMQTLGRQVVMNDPYDALGSTDMGNVSQLLPAIHPFVRIASTEVTTHSIEFREAAASEAGFNGMLDAAKAMAMIVADLLSDNNLMEQVKTEFCSYG